MRKHVYLVTVILVLGIVVLKYQACGQKHDFEKKAIVENFVKTFDIQAVDILFVLDDSSSMSVIIDNVEAGIASLVDMDFPPNTKMAVTYMSPVRIKDGIPDFEDPWSSLAENTPGHIQLSCKSTIDHYLNTPYNTAQTNQNQSWNGKDLYVGIEGCVDEWFAPAQEDSMGERCLKAAMTTPLYGTGSEAGSVSFYQLIQKFDQDQQRLFRPKSLVNVVFISDTHDSGSDNYYGNANGFALDDHLTVSQLQNAVESNSPGISELKFSGIVPMPSDSADSRLQGVTVIGDLPAPGHEQVSGEGLHDFAYLDYIGSTGGVAMHAVLEDWRPAMEELMQSSGLVDDVTFTLKRKATEIISVKVNSEELEDSDYELRDDGLTLVILKGLNYQFEYDVQVTYQDW